MDEEEKGFSRYMIRIPLLHIDRKGYLLMRSFKDYCKGGIIYEKIIYRLFA